MRLPLVASLIVTAFTSLASAEQPAPHFAQPPSADMPYEQMPVRMADRAQVRAKLAANRTANLGRFRAYQKAGVFPSNTYQSRKLNVWLDQDGHFCAAATIIRMSGGTALADKVAEQNNFIRLADVTQGPVMDWILTSGFTQDEIAAIQEPFEPVMVEPSVVDQGLRKREDDRLRAKYKVVEAQILKNAARSLDAATDRLMKNPTLARQLLNS